MTWTWTGGERANVAKCSHFEFGFMDTLAFLCHSYNSSVSLKSFQNKFVKTWRNFPECWISICLDCLLPIPFSGQNIPISQSFQNCFFPYWLICKHNLSVDKWRSWSKVIPWEFSKLELREESSLLLCLETKLGKREPERINAHRWRERDFPTLEVNCIHCSAKPDFKVCWKLTNWQERWFGCSDALTLVYH